MSASHATFSRPEATSAFALYIPYLQRAELCLDLCRNNIVNDEIRLIFDTPEHMLAMARQIEYASDPSCPLFCTRIDSNNKAVLVRSNLIESRRAPCAALLKQFPEPEAEDKDDDIKTVCVASNFRINIPQVTGAEVFLDDRGAPQTNQIKLQFGTQAQMREFVDTLKKSTYGASLVYDRCFMDHEVMVRLRLEKSNEGMTIFNFMPEYFINMEALAYKQRNSLRASLNFASATESTPKPEEDTTNKIRL